MDLMHLLRGYRPMGRHTHDGKIPPAVMLALKLRMGRVITALSSMWKGPDPSQLRLTRDRHGNFGQTSSSSVGLTSWEIRTLRKNWFALREQKQIGLQCFAQIFEKHPDAKGVFGLKNATLEQALDDYRVKAQALIIEDTIEMVIVDLCQDSDGLRWPLVQLGEQHYHFGNSRGFKHEYLITFGVALLDTVAQQPTTGMRRLKRWKILRMWRRFTYFVLTCLLTGYYLAMDPAYMANNSAHTRRVNASYQTASENGTLSMEHDDAPSVSTTPATIDKLRAKSLQPSSLSATGETSATFSAGKHSTCTILSPPKANPRCKRASSSHASGSSNQGVPAQHKHSAVGTMMLNVLNAPIPVNI